MYPLNVRRNSHSMLERMKEIKVGYFFLYSVHCFFFGLGVPASVIMIQTRNNPTARFPKNVTIVGAGGGDKCPLPARRVKEELEETSLTRRATIRGAVSSPRRESGARRGWRVGSSLE